MKEKIEEILESVDLLRCIETNPSNFWDSASYDDLVERLTTLIQEERKDAVEGFVDSIKWKDTKEIDITDDLIDGRSLVNQVKEYLSSIGKDK